MRSIKSLIDKIARVLLGPINRTTVFFIGAYTMLWGFWVAAPWWSVFESAQLFSTMVGIAPEVFWGGIAIASGIAITWGALKMSLNSLIIGAHVSTIHWLIVGIFYFIGDWQNTGGITSLSIAAYSAILYLNMKVNGKILHRETKEYLR